MSKANFVNNKFIGRIGGKNSFDYYHESTFAKTKTVEEQIEEAKRILGVEEIDGVQFADEYWTKVFLQNDEDEFEGGIKLILNKDDSLYSESNIAQTLEKFASDILKKDTRKNNPDKIKVYHSEEMYNKAVDEYNEMKRIASRSSVVKYGMENGYEGAISMEDLKKGLPVEKCSGEDELIVLANQTNYKLEKKITALSDKDLYELNELYKGKYPIVNEYYQAYLQMKKKYDELTQNPREMWEHIEDPSERAKARFRKLTTEEKKLKKRINKQKNLLKEDFIDCIYAKARPIVFKAPLPDSGCPSWDEYDELNREHIRCALQVVKGDDMQDDLSVIAKDLENTIKQCEFTDLQRDVLELWRADKTQEDIAGMLGITQPMVNQHINSIVKKIINKNSEKYEDWYYLNVCKGKYKKCSRCGEVKLISHFDKDKTGAMGVRGYCKECRK